MPSADNYFAIIPEWVLDHAKLSDGAVRLYGVLRRYADKDSMEAWPSVETLADRPPRTSERTIQRRLRELEHVGAITIKPRTGTSSVYYLRSRNPARRGDKSGTQGGDIGDTQTIVRENQSSYSKEERDALFEALYLAWLRRPYQDGQAMPEVQRGRINKVAKEFAAMGITPEDIAQRAIAYRKANEGMPCTPQALAGQWDALAPDSGRPVNDAETLKQQMQEAISGCGRCDEYGYIYLDDGTPTGRVAICRHEREDT